MAPNTFNRIRSQKGFSILEVLVAAGVLAIVISAWLITSSIVTKKKLALEEAAASQTAVLSLKDLLSLSATCLSSFTSAPVLNPASLPASQALSLRKSYLGEWAQNISLQVRDIMTVTTLKNGRRLLYGELRMIDVNNKTYFIGPLYFEVNSAGITQSCYSELSSKDRCLRQDGRYLEQTGQCELPQYVCASGQFMVSAGVQKWNCK